MNIIDSDLGYLGYYGPEAYGMVYKTRGCDATHPDVCAALHVYGTQRHSHFHHNYMGTYTYDAYDMTFEGNEYDHNVMYGLDPHDDSDHLTITGNHAHHNWGSRHHLLPALRPPADRGQRSRSQRADPHVAPGDQALDSQIHEIMVHRGVTDTVIEHNNVHDQPNGASIAVFDSSNITIRNNTVVGNKFGLRYSHSAHDVTTIGNTVRTSAQYAVYTFKGTGKSHHGNILTTRPARLTFTGNAFNDSGGHVFLITESDTVAFTHNTIGGKVRPAVIQDSTGVTFSGNTAAAGLLPATGG
jgi:mannuronan 5-epimerase